MISVFSLFLALRRSIETKVYFLFQRPGRALARLRAFYPQQLGESLDRSLMVKWKPTEVFIRYEKNEDNCENLLSDLAQLLYDFFLATRQIQDLSQKDSSEAQARRVL